jgi:hypothetical protein
MRFKIDKDLMNGVPQTITDESLTLEVLSLKDVEGFFAIQPVTSGAGTFKVEWLGALEDLAANYQIPYKTDGTQMDAIIAAGKATGTSEPYGFAPPLTSFGKVKVTAVGEVTITRLPIRIK